MPGHTPTNIYPEYPPGGVLPGRALDSVRVLITDANVVASGFHDVTLVNMADAVRPTVPVGDLNLLRRQWPGLCQSYSEETFCE